MLYESMTVNHTFCFCILHSSINTVCVSGALQVYTSSVWWCGIESTPPMHMIHLVISYKFS